MNLERQVAPLAESQRLKELGMPQDTLFAWWVRKDGPSVSQVCYIDELEGEYFREIWERACAAPTVAELGEMLPLGASHDKREAGWFMDGRDCFPFNHHEHWAGEGPLVQGPDDMAANAARLLIALVERGIVKWEAE